MAAFRRTIPDQRIGNLIRVKRGHHWLWTAYSIMLQRTAEIYLDFLALKLLHSLLRCTTSDQGLEGEYRVLLEVTFAS